MQPSTALAAARLRDSVRFGFSLRLGLTFSRWRRKLRFRQELERLCQAVRLHVHPHPAQNRRKHRVHALEHVVVDSDLNAVRSQVPSRELCLVGRVERGTTTSRITPCKVPLGQRSARVPSCSVAGSVAPLPSRSPPPRRASNVRFVLLFRALDQETVMVVAAIAGLLGAVAYADREYSPAESLGVRTELARVQGMPDADVNAIGAVLEARAVELSRSRPAPLPSAPRARRSRATPSSARGPRGSRSRGRRDLRLGVQRAPASDHGARARAGRLQRAPGQAQRPSGRAAAHLSSVEGCAGEAEFATL